MRFPHFGVYPAPLPTPAQPVWTETVETPPDNPQPVKKRGDHETNDHRLLREAYFRRLVAELGEA